MFANLVLLFISFIELFALFFLFRVLLVFVFLIIFDIYDLPELFLDIFGIDPEHSFNDADHHRWLRINTEDGALVEIRPDHGISGGYRSDSKYMNLDTLSGLVSVVRNNEDVLYYVIMKKSSSC